MSAAYSGTPLAKKLGIVKQGLRVRTENAPVDYDDLIGTLPESVLVSSKIRKSIDVWHMFTASKEDLERRLPAILSSINRDGAIWVSWPKKSSGVLSTVTEDTVREIGLPLGLVDIKVCAVDDVWSGLKLVIRKELR